MTARRAYWLVKSEPFKFPWAQLVKDRTACWDGVRNFEARNNLRAMKEGDLLFFYHSNEGKEIVGVATVSREAYQDPTTEDDWSVVDIAPLVALETPVTLATIKATKSLADMALLSRMRLSVTSVSAKHFKKILELGKTKLPESA